MAMVFAVRLFLGSVLFMAGLAKVFDRPRLAATLANYGLLPHPADRVYAFFLPWVEILVGILIIAGLFMPYSALLAFALVASFVTATAIAMNKGLNLECDCFGLLYRERVGRRTLVRDLILLCMALAVAIFDEGSLSLPRLYQRLPSWPASLGLGIVIASSAGSVLLGLLATGRFPRLPLASTLKPRR